MIPFDDSIQGWKNTGPLGFSDPLTSIAYGNGTLVAVGDKGAAAISTDGLVWSRVATGVIEPLRGIAWGMGMFVAVGNGGRVITSTNGSLWQISDSGSKANLGHVIFQLSQFIAVGGEFSQGQDESVVIVSDDGARWSVKDTRPGGWLNSIVRGTDRYIAVGNEGKVLSSPDATQWQVEISGATLDLLGVAYGNGVFTAVGGKYFDTSSPILTSTNGTRWTISRPFSDNGALADVIFAANQFIAVGGGTIGRGHFNRSFTSIVTSPDGLTWTNRGVKLANDWLAGVAFAQDTVVAVGFNGLILQSSQFATGALTQSSEHLAPRRDK